MSNKVNVKKVSILLVLSFALVLCSCGQAGTWEDDPGNWQRAFRSQKPDSVNVLHSWYWGSSHFTYEFQYFFEIESNEELEAQLFSENNLKMLAGQEAKDAIEDLRGEKPEWFIPKGVEDYEIYVFADEPRRNFWVYIDKESGVIFLTDYQV